MSGRGLFCSLAAVLVLLPLASIAEAKVAIIDRVGMVEKTVTLAVRTTKFFTADGGRRVSLVVDGEPVGEILTGGDGYGYFRLTPRRAGLLKVSARSNDHEASGLLLILNKVERVVLVEMETVLATTLFQPSIREECVKTLKSLGQRYRLIFVKRFLSADFWRTRLEKVGVGPAVVISWKGVATLENLSRHEVRLHAVIGSAEMATAAREHVAYRISFEKTQAARTVSGWEEILKILGP